METHENVFVSMLKCFDYNILQLGRRHKQDLLVASGEFKAVKIGRPRAIIGAQPWENVSILPGRLDLKNHIAIYFVWANRWSLAEWSGYKWITSWCTSELTRGSKTRSGTWMSATNIFGVSPFDQTCILGTQVGRKRVWHWKSCYMVSSSSSSSRYTARSHSGSHVVVFKLMPMALWLATIWLNIYFILKSLLDWHLLCLFMWLK
jgi:hypothetical protein